MKHLTGNARALLMAGAMLGSTAAAAQATIPTSLHGTYDLSFAYATSSSPLPNGATTTMTIAPGGILCIADYILTDPVAQGAEGIWSSSEAGVKLAISNITSGAFNEVNVSSLADVWHGQFIGTKISNSTDCGGSALPDFTSLDELFELAESTYAGIFAGSASGYRILEDFVYRYYSSTGVYLAVHDGQVYVMGGEFGDAPSAVGNLSSVIAQLSGTDPVDIPEGDFNLTVSGTVQAIVGGMGGVQTPFSVSIQNLPAPDTSDIEDMEDAVRESLESVGTLNSLQVTVVESSSSRVIFDVTFSATTTSGGMTITSNYSLRYDYVRQ